MEEINELSRSVCVSVMHFKLADPSKYPSSSPTIRSRFWASQILSVAAVSRQYPRAASGTAFGDPSCAGGATKILHLDIFLVEVAHVQSSTPPASCRQDSDLHNLHLEHVFCISPVCGAVSMTFVAV